MADTLRDAARERLHARAVLTWTAALAILWTVFEPTLAQFAITVVSTAVLGVVQTLSDVYDLREPVANVGLGAYALLGGLALLLFDPGTAWVPAAFLAAGCWFVLDAVQTVRHEGATEPEVERDGHDVYRDYVARRVHETLRERPLTRRELDDALEADADAIDDAVERLRERGVVVREGSELRAASRERGEEGRLARTRNWAAGIAGRIARPITVEFEREDDADGERRDESVARSADRGRSGTVSDDGAGAENAGDRERERELETETAGSAER